MVVAAFGKSFSREGVSGRAREEKQDGIIMLDVRFCRRRRRRRTTTTTYLRLQAFERRGGFEVR